AMVIDHMVVYMFRSGLRILHRGLLPGHGPNRLQTVGVHNRPDRGLGDVDTLVLEQPGQLAPTRHPLSIRILGCDRLHQLLVPHGPMRWLPGVAPSVKRGPRNLEYSAHHGNRIGGLLGFDELVAIYDCCFEAKKALTFERNST